MNVAPRDYGVLLLHGMGEQKRLEHLRASARELASAVAGEPDLQRISIIDRMDGANSSVAIEAVFLRDGTEERIRLNLVEIWWADLGIGGGILEHLKFWRWGLGQWAARAVRKGDRTRNTEKLMALPRFAGDASSMEATPWRRRLPAIVMLFGAGLHIRYFHPRAGGTATMPGAIANALVSPGRTTLSAAAGQAAISPAAAWGRGLTALGQVATLGLALTLAAAALLLAIGRLMPEWLQAPIARAIGWLCPALLAMLESGGWRPLAASGILVLILSCLIVLGAGLARLARERSG